MKKYFYFGAFLLLTASDWILGYKTATSDFGLQSIWAIFWAGGFSMFSVPIKQMYDRLVDKPYYQLGVYGKVIYILFSILWLFVFYNAFSGISDLRLKDLKKNELKNYQSSISIKPVKSDTIVAQNRFQYRLQKEQLKYQHQQDSINSSFQREQISQLRKKEFELTENSSIQGFLYFNILLILTAGICLSLAFKDEEVEQKTDIISNLKPSTISIDLEKSYNDLVKHGTPIEEEKEIIYEDSGRKKYTMKEIFTYRCKDCGRDFKGHQLYNAHFKSNTVCMKGNFEKFKPVLT